MSLCTIPNTCYGHHKCFIMFVAGISVKMFTASSTLFFLIKFVIKQEITLSYFFICFSKPLDLSLTKFKKKSKYTLRTKFKVKVKVQPYK